MKQETKSGLGFVLENRRVLYDLQYNHFQIHYGLFLTAFKIPAFLFILLVNLVGVIRLTNG